MSTKDSERVRRTLDREGALGYRPCRSGDRGDLGVGAEHRRPSRALGFTFTLTERRHSLTSTTTPSPPRREKPCRSAPTSSPGLRHFVLRDARVKDPRG